MRPTDRGTAIAAADPMETLLRAAFAADPGTTHLARMDARLERALELGPARLAPRPWRRAAWMLAAAGMIAVIAGAGTIALQRFEGWSGPEFDVAWERAAVLGLTATVDGYEITLERAYADAAQVWVAVAIEDLEKRPGTIQLGGLQGTLVEDTLGEFPMMGGEGGPLHAHESDETWQFDPPTFPLEPGPRHFTLSVDQIEFQERPPEGMTAPPVDGGPVDRDPFHQVKGEWRFEFDLDVAGGAFVDGDVEARGPRGATLALDSFLVSPTRTRVTFKVDGVEAPADWWPVEVTARHGSTVVRFSGSQSLGAGVWSEIAYEGMDDPSGTWIVTVGEIVGPPAAGIPLATPGPSGEIVAQSQRLRGPWTMVVEVP